MKLIKKIGEMTAFSKRAICKGLSIGLVPTMGYLHEGHLSLMRRARIENDILVISIFVNPIQFGPQEDFKRYPRDLRRDMRLAASVGTDIIFCPSVKDMYQRQYQTYIDVQQLSRYLCGRSRPGHFKGVAAVVTKLFNIVKPQIAYFGQKDAQQARIIQQMVKDLNMDLKIRILPIFREKDGLAMSSRNTYLNPDERSQARCLYEALHIAKKLIEYRQKNATKIIDAMRGCIKRQPLAKTDYIAIVDADTLKDVKRISGKTLIALAVKIGKTRLIDNMVINA